MAATQIVAEILDACMPSISHYADAITCLEGERLQNEHFRGVWLWDEVDKFNQMCGFPFLGLHCAPTLQEVTEILTFKDAGYLTELLTFVKEGGHISKRYHDWFQANILKL